MRPKMIAFVVVLATLFLAGGCARQVPLGDLSAGGAVVGVIARTVDGEEIRGELLSFTAGEMVVLAEYEEGNGVRIDGFGDNRRVTTGGGRVDGEVVRVDRVDGVRVARVRRVIRTPDIERATFHRSRGEASLASILSLLLGPSVGGLLALAI